MSLHPMYSQGASLLILFQLEDGFVCLPTAFAHHFSKTVWESEWNGLLPRHLKILYGLQQGSPS